MSRIFGYIFPLCFLSLFLSIILYIFYYIFMFLLWLCIKHFFDFYFLWRCGEGISFFYFPYPSLNFLTLQRRVKENWCTTDQLKPGKGGIANEVALWRDYLLKWFKQPQQQWTAKINSSFRRCNKPVNDMTTVTPQTNNDGTNSLSPSSLQTLITTIFSIFLIFTKFTVVRHKDFQVSNR